MYDQLFTELTHLVICITQQLIVLCQICLLLYIELIFYPIIILASYIIQAYHKALDAAKTNRVLVFHASQFCYHS